MPDVYAIGDCTAITLANGLPLPKAGIFAHAQGEVVAARIAARLAGRPPTATFVGEGYCFIETGGGRAAKAEGQFLADPVEVEISEPSAGGLLEKREFERARLTEWFGR
jgi:sulfide:quinone oxidoreductase